MELPLLPDDARPRDRARHPVRAVRSRCSCSTSTTSRRSTTSTATSAATRSSSSSPRASAIIREVDTAGPLRRRGVRPDPARDRPARAPSRPPSGSATPCAAAPFGERRASVPLRVTVSHRRRGLPAPRGDGRALIRRCGRRALRGQGRRPRRVWWRRRPSATAGRGSRARVARAARTRAAPKAVIPAAGLGTRFLPATKASPKEMLPVVDKPAIQYVVEEAVAGRPDRRADGHRAQQERARGPLRPQRRARGGAGGQGRRRRGSRRSAHASRARDRALRAPGRPAGPRARGAVRGRARRRRAVRGAARRRPHRRARPPARADGRGAAARRAAASSRSWRCRASRSRSTAAPPSRRSRRRRPRHRPGREAPGRRGAEQPRDHRALRALARRLRRPARDRRRGAAARSSSPTRCRRCTPTTSRCTASSSAAGATTPATAPTTCEAVVRLAVDRDDLGPDFLAWLREFVADRGDSRSTSTSGPSSRRSARSPRSSCRCSTRTAASSPRTSSPPSPLPRLRQLRDGRLRRARGRRRPAPPERAGRRCPSSATSPPGPRVGLCVQPGLCVRIMTGAPMPPGADAVVPVEWTDGGHRPGRAISRVPDARRLHPPGRRGRAARASRCCPRAPPRRRAGRAARRGRAAQRSLVRPRPRVVVMSTGSELVEPGDAAGAGPDRRRQQLALDRRGREAGGSRLPRRDRAGRPAPCSPTSLEDQLVRADVRRHQRRGERRRLRRGQGRARRGWATVAVRAGSRCSRAMPQGFGTVGPDAIPVFGLPGNPVSALVVVRGLRAAGAARACSAPSRCDRPAVLRAARRPGTGATPARARAAVPAGRDVAVGDGRDVGDARSAGPGSHLVARDWRRRTRLVVVPEDVTERRRRGEPGRRRSSLRAGAAE